MKRKNNQNKMLAATLALLLVGASLLIAAASSASRRSKSELESEVPASSAEKHLPLESILENITQVPKETESADESESEQPESEPTALTVDEISFSSPLDGNVIVSCSLTAPVYSLTMNDYRTHCGVDISASLGDTVLCCADGTVSRIWDDPMMGKSVSVNHGSDVESIYKNLSPELAEGLVEGCSLKAGQAIGTVGESALIECEEECHLHLELKVSGNYVDPAEYIALKLANEVYEDISDMQ